MPPWSVWPVGGGAVCVDGRCHAALAGMVRRLVVRWCVCVDGRCHAALVGMVRRWWRGGGVWGNGRCDVALAGRSFSLSLCLIFSLFFLIISPLEKSGHPSQVGGWGGVMSPWSAWSVGGDGALSVKWL